MTSQGEGSFERSGTDRTTLPNFGASIVCIECGTTMTDGLRHFGASAMSDVTAPTF